MLSGYIFDISVQGLRFKQKTDSYMQQLQTDSSAQDTDTALHCRLQPKEFIPETSTQRSQEPQLCYREEFPKEPGRSSFGVQQKETESVE